TTETPSCSGSFAVSVSRLAIGSHVIVEPVVRHLRTAHLARLDVDRIGRGVPRRGKGLRVAAQHVGQHARSTCADAVAGNDSGFCWEKSRATFDHSRNGLVT